MPFKLLSIVLSAGLLNSVVVLNSAAVFAQTEERFIGHRGEIHGLRSTTVKTFAVRPDGRYLWFSDGSATFNVIDLQDFAHVGSAEAVDGPVFEVALDATNDDRLIVVTSEGVQYFRVDEPFNIEDNDEEGTKFERPESPTTDVLDACVDNTNRIYFLEEHPTGNAHILRVVEGTSSQGTITWSNIFSNTSVSPLAIRCTLGGILIFGTVTVSGNLEFRITRMSLASVPVKQEEADFSSDINTDYGVIDFMVNASEDKLFVMYDRLASGSSEDTIVREANISNLNSRINHHAGSKGAALATYLDGPDPTVGFFVGEDRLENDTPVDTDEFLSVLESSLAGTPSADPYDRGTGSASVGAVFGSEWLNVAADHYKFGLTEAAGVVLLSDAPTLSLSTVPDPDGQVLTTTNTLDFTLTSDLDVDYAIYFDQDAPDEGTVGGISEAPGRLIKTGILLEGVATAFSLTSADLAVDENDFHSLVIFVEDKSTLLDIPRARTGLRFKFDPPPDAISDFRLGFGSNSVHAFFKKVIGGDIATYNVHFALTAAGVSDAVLVANVDTTVTNSLGTLTSPIRVAPEDFDDRVIIGPVDNDVEVFVRISVIDDSAQLSTGNPAALSITPSRTRTLLEALGSANSCSLRPVAFDRSGLALLLIFLVILLASRRHLSC